MTANDFVKCFDDNDMQFNEQFDDKADRYISIYTIDCPLIRELLEGTWGKLDKQYVYGVDYWLNFYTNYYPYTNDVDIEVSLCVDLCDEKDIKRIYNVYHTCDVDFNSDTIILSAEQKKIISEAAKEYIGEKDLHLFYQYSDEYDQER